MLRYIDKKVTFAEVPDEISLSYSISNCDGLCEGCHSPELRGDSGHALTESLVHDIQIYNKLGITCVCFLGEGAKNPDYEEEWIQIFELLKSLYPSLKIAMYSGKNEQNVKFLPYLTYYKIGPYIATRGPLNKKTTNQHLYLISQKDNQIVEEDITYKF